MNEIHWQDTQPGLGQSMAGALFDIVHWVRSTYGVVGLTTLIVYSATAIELIEKDPSGKEGGQ